MIIPMRYPRMQAGRRREPIRPGVRARVSGPERFDRLLNRIVRSAAAGVRAFLLLFALTALIWNVPVVVYANALYLAVTLMISVLGLGMIAHAPIALALIADSLTIALILQGTGCVDSPIFALVILLVLQGALLGRGPAALAGGAGGIAILMLTYRHSAGSLLGALAIGQSVSGIAAAWLREQERAALGAQHRQRQDAEQASREDRRADRVADWQRRITQIDACVTIEALARAARECAMEIAGAPATVEVLRCRQPAYVQICATRSFQVPIPCGATTGRIEVGVPGHALDRAQHAALEQLASMTGLRALVVSGEARMLRQQAALMALWESAGMLRVAPEMQTACLEVFHRLALALDLDWMAIFAPSERVHLAPVVFARGGASSSTPPLSGAQLRVAAEALRVERPLVRSEGQAVLFCLPLRVAAGTQLVLAARGAAADDATQTLLMLLGELLITRLRTDLRVSVAVLDDGV